MLKAAFTALARVRLAVLAAAVLLAFAAPAFAHHGADTETGGSVLWSAAAFAGLALLVGAVVFVVIRLLTKQRE